ncbi:MAG: DUF6886 family protein [Saccharofermentanales bacterium]
MRVYHVSEEPNIKEFLPRLPTRNDMNPNIGLVWALCERTLPNFLTPRDCPRVCYHVGRNTSQSDIQKYMLENCSHVVIIEKNWLEQLRNTVLYVYEFDDTDFYLQDECAGYYVSEKKQLPCAVNKIDDIELEVKKHNTELRTVDNLWNIAEEIKGTKLNWSLCRMAFAKGR